MCHIRSKKTARGGKGQDGDSCCASFANFVEKSSLCCYETNNLVWKEENEEEYCLEKMYAIYKQTHPPTGVEHCVHCHFVSSVESNLIVAGTSQLRIYKFYTQDEVRVTILLLKLDIMLLCLLLLNESDKSVRHTPPLRTRYWVWKR